MFQKPVKIGHFELLLITNARGLQDLPFIIEPQKNIFQGGSSGQMNWNYRLCGVMSYRIVIICENNPTLPILLISWALISNTECLKDPNFVQLIELLYALFFSLTTESLSPTARKFQLFLPMMLLDFIRNIQCHKKLTVRD